MVMAAFDRFMDGVGSMSLTRMVDFTESDKDDKNDPLTGWCKVVPRGLRITFGFDVLSAATIALSLFSKCDQPLKIWLFGGILLGLPASWLINRIAKMQPNYMHYRLKADALRGGGDPDTMRIKTIRLFDRMTTLIPKEEAGRDPVVERADKGYWIVSLPFKAMITGYQIVTSPRDSRDLYPTGWVFEGSHDGVEWELIDAVDSDQVTVPEPGGEYERFEELMHLEDSAAIFRAAFAIEVLANAAAFAWLVKGTMWVEAGAEYCPDGAPLLWHVCFIIVVLAWSLLGTVTMGLIVSAVAMVVLGVRTPSRS